MNLYIKKLETILFYTLIFFIPLQTRKLIHAWWDTEFNEYLSVFVYVTDIIVFTLLFFWLTRTWVLRGSDSPSSKRGLAPLVVFGGVLFVIAAVSLVNADTRGVGFYQLVKLGEFLLLFFYICFNIKNYDFGKIAGVFVASGVLQSLWAGAQFFAQSDFGLKILGESPLASDLPYVANFFVGSVKVIRAYGGFPHPNVLAAFLITSLFLVYWLFLKRGETRFQVFVSFSRLRSNVFLAAALFILLFGLVVTFSRVAIGVYVVGTLAFLGLLVLHRNLREHYEAEVVNLLTIIIACTVILIATFSPYLFARFQLDSREEAVTHRVEYAEQASGQIRGHVLFGVGIGNFIPTFKESLAGEAEGFYQPVHNIYLLIASEMGIAGLAIVISFLTYLFYRGFKAFRSTRDQEKQLLFIVYSLLFTTFLIMAFFDHFFWTLQQGRLMFWIVLGLFAGLVVPITQKEN